jgi:hypothetical protein
MRAAEMRTVLVMFNTVRLSIVTHAHKTLSSQRTVFAYSAHSIRLPHALGGLVGAAECPREPCHGVVAGLLRRRGGLGNILRDTTH